MIDTLLGRWKLIATTLIATISASMPMLSGVGSTVTVFRIVAATRISRPTRTTRPRARR